MVATRLVTASWEVDERLTSFGVSRHDLFEIVRAVVAARANAVDDDPASAEGLLAYIFGTRALRQVFRQRGWLKHREDNVESVKHPDSNLKIVYQSVDMAADEYYRPQAVSGKGSGADRLIAAGQKGLFAEAELEALRRRGLSELKTGAWFFCVSVDGDDVRAELSLPSGIIGGNFDTFIERIFIVHSGEWSGGTAREVDVPNAIEFEPSVSRK